MFLALLLHAHYNTEMQQRFVKLMIDKFALGKTITDRCHFIMFLHAATQVLDAESFNLYFVPEI